MGTTMSISIAGADTELAHRAAEAAFQEIRRLEGLMSTYLMESDVSRVNRAAGGTWTAVDPEVLGVIREALRYARLSGGAFDITFKPLARLWQFEAGSVPPSPAAVQEVLPLVDYRAVLIDGDGRVRLRHPGMAIGLGGIAKGYAADRAAEVLREKGIANATINAGGDVRVMGRPSAERPWRIGIQHPRKRQALLDEVSLSAGAVATSGDYERFFVHEGVQYHHILDSRTGFPARGCMSITVIGETAMMADALSTAAFVLGPEAGLALIEELPGAEAMFVDASGEIHRTRGFQGGGGT
jgi:thiamine biosynthesis lipoprotein